MSLVRTTKLIGTCGEITGEVRRCVPAHSQVCLNGECDLRKEEIVLFEREISDNHK